MTIHFMCSCGSRTYSLPNKMAEQNVRCPNCKTIIVVPKPSESGQVVIALPSENVAT